MGLPYSGQCTSKALKYYQIVKEARGTPVKDSLLLEAVESLMVKYQSMPILVSLHRFRRRLHTARCLLVTLAGRILCQTRWSCCLHLFWDQLV
jgi:hypothetical protein